LGVDSAANVRRRIASSRPTPRDQLCALLRRLPNGRGGHLAKDRFQLRFEHPVRVAVRIAEPDVDTCNRCVDNRRGDRQIELLELVLDDPARMVCPPRQTHLAPLR
jgi:hypothetical protein